MRFWSTFVIFLLMSLALACGARKPSTPVETFMTYVKAMKKKDTATMKLLLSDDTLKMHEQEAKAQGVAIDEIIKRETLIGETQKAVDYRNEKIDGEKATLEYKNPYEIWETLPFVREGGEWKIDKRAFAEQMMQDINEQQQQRLEEIINGSTTPVY